MFGVSCLLQNAVALQFAGEDHSPGDAFEQEFKNFHVAASLETRFHRLAGSGGSYGFPAITTVARDAEQWLRLGPSPSETPRLDAAVTRLEEIVGEAAKGLE